MMDELRNFHDILLKQVGKTFFRFRYEGINWNNRMLAIRGPRGAGKTTLMLQYLKYGLKAGPEALYVTADHSWFYNHTLLELAHSFHSEGGKVLFVDEVHKYPRWSRELKNIYDGFPDMRVVFSASSALDIYRGEADLSRRVITYDLPGISFREYLLFREGLSFPTVSLPDLLKHHRKLALDITTGFHPLPHFRQYLRSGYLPIISESTEGEYLVRLGQIINAVVDNDLSYIEGYDAGRAIKVKKLLGVIAESAPFKPNVANLARKIEISRDSVYNYLGHLQNARLLNFLTVEGKGTALLQKPDKIYMENTNLAHALKPTADMGSLRESFVLNQLVNAGHEVALPERGDFTTGGIVIEVGGKNKGMKQVDGLPNAYIAADDIETGFGNKVPLWLFGFLY